MTRLLVVSAAAVGLILLVAFVVSKLALARTRGLSIRLQVFIALAAIIGTFAFGLGVVVIDRVEARAVRLADHASEDEARALAGIVGAELERQGLDLGAIARRFEQELATGAELRFELLDATGRRLFPAEPDALQEEAATVSETAPILRAGREVGFVRVTKPTVEMRRLLAEVAPAVLVASLVLGAAAALAAAWIGRAIAQPIEALTAFAERVSQGERTAAPPLVAGREVSQLRRSVDSMRRELEGRPFVEAFAADLSHELKNPVAAIRAAAELLDEGALDEPAEAKRFVRRIREATARIERLLSDLLSLARIEARGADASAVVELGALARQLVEGLDASSSCPRVTLRAETDLSVRGEPVWLTRALENLVHNALVHSPAGTPVAVTLRREAGDLVTRVENDGEIPPRRAKRIFGRFVTTRADQGGTGLGLALVRAVAEAHGGTAVLAEAGPPRVCFELRLPLARGPLIARA